MAVSTRRGRLASTQRWSTGSSNCSIICSMTWVCEVGATLAPAGCGVADAPPAAAPLRPVARAGEGAVLLTVGPPPKREGVAVAGAAAGLPATAGGPGMPFAAAWCWPASGLTGATSGLTTGEAAVADAAAGAPPPGLALSALPTDAGDLGSASVLAGLTAGDLAPPAGSLAAAA